MLAAIAVATGCQPIQPWRSEPVSVSASAPDILGGNDVSVDADFSPDGTKVVFVSEATDLGPADNSGGDPTASGGRDVYLRDLTTGTTSLVSVNAAGTDSGNATSEDPQFSPDGTKVVFTSAADDLGPTDSPRSPPPVAGLFEEDIYVRDLVTGTTSLVSANAAGTDSANGFSTHPRFAGNDKVVFVSNGDDLGPTDSTRGSGGAFDFFLQGDVYVRDLVTGTTSLVSTNADGTDSGDGVSGWSVVSADGTKVAFHSAAANLGPADHDRNANPFDSAAEQDLYVRDLAAAVTSLVSVNAAGTDSADAATTAFQAEFSPDGSQIAFSSAASDLVPTDTNGQGDVYVRDLDASTTRLVSANAAGTDTAAGLSQDPVFSPDGSEIAFTSTAGDLGPPDPGDRTDLYLRSLETGETTLVSVNAAGTGGGNQHSVVVAFSPDGSRIAFMSQASDLGPRDTNGTRFDIYVRARDTATTTLVSSRADGADSGNAPSEDPEFSPDGRLVLFGSDASDLGPPDGNGSGGDIFLATPHGADLVTTLDTSPEPVRSGRKLTYDLVVRNDGPDAADDVSVTMLLPEGTRPHDADLRSQQCRFDRPRRLASCDLGEIEAGDEVTVTVAAKVTAAPGTTLEALALAGSPTIDPASRNNLATVTSTVR
jgi:uncharacterized repeat protein (TIGR01451 family)